MRLKIKKGEELVFNAQNGIEFFGDELIINFNHKWTYNSFAQKKNHLIIDTMEGEIDLVFTGEVVNLKFQSYDKDQLILIEANDTYEK